MSIETEKLLIENLLSSNELFSRCIQIIRPSYFERELRNAVKFILDYYQKYHTSAPFNFLNAEFNLDFKQNNLDAKEIRFMSEYIENFCRKMALYDAIMDSAKDLSSEKSEENYGKIKKRIDDALSISIQRELGIDVFENVESRLEKYHDTDIYEKTNINAIDDAITGLSRKTFTLFSANSGGGKSIMMANIGANYAKRGFHVIQLALELTEQMIDLRDIAILTGVPIAEWKSNSSEIISTMKAYKNSGAGSLVIKRFPQSSTANDFRSYIKLYETEYKRKPDVIIVDYLDLMSPNSGISHKDVYQQDKEKSEELNQIFYDYNAIGISASQQNRDAIRNQSPDQAIIAGGISKINTVDNYISIYMNKEMRAKGECFLYFLKTRSSSAVGRMVQLAFNPDNLIFSDKLVTSVGIISDLKRRKKEGNFSFPGVEGNIEASEEFIDILINLNDQVNNVVNEDMQSKIDKIPIDMENDSEIWNTKNILKLSSYENEDEMNKINELINL